jgi:hypothetical protein
MATIVVVLLTCILTLAAGQNVSFEVDGSKAMLMADWLPKTK